jgi:uncharacterized membrane protein
MAIGLAAGSIIGLVTRNIGLWIPVGLAIGVALGALASKTSDKNNADEGK